MDSQWTPKCLIDTIEKYNLEIEVERCKIALFFITDPMFSVEEVDQLRQKGVTAFVGLDPDTSPYKEREEPYTIRSADDFDILSLDYAVIFDRRYWDVYQYVGTNPQLRQKVMDADLPIIPYSVRADRYPLLPQEYLDGVPLDQVRLADTIYQYISRNNLTGGYAEFGTWFGRSFYKSVLHFFDQLQGDFWAFDSFGGLPATRIEEVEYSKGDFSVGRYFCNEASFRAIGKLSFPNSPDIMNRVKVVKGYYEDSLDRKTIQDYGIEPMSISYCSVDCDLYDATLSVLRFIEPALCNGAVLYLDDYRMARAAKEASLYGAVKTWLTENPAVELINLHRDHWQHQYVIFNRY